MLGGCERSERGHRATKPRNTTVSFKRLREAPEYSRCLISTSSDSVHAALARHRLLRIGLRGLRVDRGGSVAYCTFGRRLRGPRGASDRRVGRFTSLRSSFGRLLAHLGLGGGRRLDPAGRFGLVLASLRPSRSSLGSAGIGRRLAAALRPRVRRRAASSGERTVTGSNVMRDW